MRRESCATPGTDCACYYALRRTVLYAVCGTEVGYGVTVIRGPTVRNGGIVMRVVLRSERGTVLRGTEVGQRYSSAQY